MAEPRGRERVETERWGGENPPPWEDVLGADNVRRLEQVLEKIDISDKVIYELHDHAGGVTSGRVELVATGAARAAGRPKPHVRRRGEIKQKPPEQKCFGS